MMTSHWSWRLAVCVCLSVLIGSTSIGCKKKNANPAPPQPSVPINEPDPPVIEAGTLQSAVDAWTIAGGVADPAAMLGMAVPDAQNAALVHGQFVEAMYLVSDEDMRTLRDPWEEDVEEIVARHADALANVHVAVTLPFVNWASPLDKGLSELGLRYIPYCQRIALLLRAEAIHHARTGDLNAAMKSIEAGLIVGRHAGQEPVIECAQVQDWCEVVMLGAVRRLFVEQDVPDSPVLDQTLESSDARARLAKAILGSGTLAIIEIGREDGNQWAVPVPDGQYEDDLARDLLWTMDAWAKVAGELATPYYERDDSDPLPEFPPTWAPLSYTYFPEVAPIDEFAARCDTVRTLARTAQHLRARRAQIGRYPPPDKYASQLPIDPYTGDPVVYALDGDGFVLTTSAYDANNDATNVFRWAWK